MIKKQAPSHPQQNDKTGEIQGLNGVSDPVLGGVAGPVVAAQELTQQPPKALSRKKGKNKNLQGAADDTADTTADSNPAAGAPEAATLLAMAPTEAPQSISDTPHDVSSQSWGAASPSTGQGSEGVDSF